MIGNPIDGGNLACRQQAFALNPEGCVMKTEIVVAIVMAILLSPSLSVAQNTSISKSELKKCINYYDKLEEKEGNINRLESVLDEAEAMANSFGRKMKYLRSQISTTIGAKRNNLINEYNKQKHNRNKFVHVYNLALDKHEKRVEQYNRILGTYQSRCENVSVSKADFEEVCRGKVGFCDVFR
ncbi:hypothetical protein [Syntrophotalea carbinolica]|nr:hypothetical protein [Syntrophotalea carbinolica]